MIRGLVALCVGATVSVPVTADAIMGAGYCRERVPIIVTVKKGDTLTGLAKLYCHDASKYQWIASANEIPNPHLIREGRSLEIPCQTYLRTRLESVSLLCIWDD